MGHLENFIGYKTRGGVVVSVVVFFVFVAFFVVVFIVLVIFILGIQEGERK